VGAEWTTHQTRHRTRHTATASAMLHGRPPNRWAIRCGQLKILLSNHSWAKWHQYNVCWLNYHTPHIAVLVVVKMGTRNKVERYHSWFGVNSLKVA
jgi:hypothetical protein